MNQNMSLKVYNLLLKKILQWRNLAFLIPRTQLFSISAILHPIVPHLNFSN